MWKNSVARYSLNGIEETLKLSEQLHEGTYKAKKPKKFTLTHPKKREAVSIAFRDRVYQRSLNDNVLYPIMTNSFIYPNFACQKGKGTDVAMDTLDLYMKRAFKQRGYECYVLQCDIKGYYPNMSHEVAEKTFHSKLPQVAYDMVEEILHHQYVDEVGYNPGSQMIQIAGISVLDGLDHYIKEQLHIKLYIRYMDDFILIHENKGYLEKCKEKIEIYLNKISFNLHEEKTKIYPISEGIKMLGFLHKITDTGKVLRIVDPKNVKNERKKLRKMVALAKSGALTREKVDQCYDSWKAHIRRGNSFNLQRNMDEFYKKLWRDE